MNASATKIKVFEALVRYALAKYPDTYDRVAPGCPYETRMGGYRAFRQEVTWFVYEWQNPDTGTTILEEFVASRVKSKEQAARLLRRKDVTYGEFEVVSAAVGRTSGSGADDTSLLVIRAADTQKEYNLIAPRPVNAYGTGTRFVGRIHPYDDSNTYRVCGVLCSPGEWDDDTFDAAITSAGLADRERVLAHQTAGVLEKSRVGPGRNNSDTIGIANKTYKSSNADSIEEALAAELGHDGIRKLVSRINKEEAAINAALLTKISPSPHLKDVMDAYPIDLLKMICHERDIESLPSAGAMAERISDRLPTLACMAVQSMAEAEKRALAVIIYNGFMPYSDDMQELDRFAETPEPVYMNDPDGIKGFVKAYASTGILIVGTAILNGRDQKIVTVAFEIKEALMRCPIWQACMTATALAEP